MKFWALFVRQTSQHICLIICCVFFFMLHTTSYAQRNTTKSYRKKVCKGDGCQQTKVRSSTKRMNYPIGTRYRKVGSTSRAGYRRSVCRGKGCYQVKYTVPQRDLNYKPSFNPRKAQRFSRYNPKEQRIEFRLRDVGYTCAPRKRKSHTFRRYSCYEQPIQFRLREYRYSCTPRMKKSHTFRRYSCYEQPIRFRLKEYSYSCYAKLQKARRFSRYTCYPIKVPNNSCLLNQQECPIQFDKPTRWQVIKHDTRNFFRNKHKHCKLMGRYTGVGKGNYITTSKGEAIVSNFKVKKKIDHPIKIVVRIVPEDLSKIKYGKHGKRKIKMKRKVIKKAETKRIMIREMTYRGRYDWILAAYPEESLKLVDFQAQYEGPPIPFNIAIDVQPPENKKDKKKKAKIKKKVTKEKERKKKQTERLNRKVRKQAEYDQEREKKLEEKEAQMEGNPPKKKKEKTPQ